METIMNKLLNIAAMFALTTSLSFACDKHSEENCSADDKCEWNDEHKKCAEKPIDCSMRDISDCGKDESGKEDKKCSLKKGAEGETDECVPAEPTDASKEKKDKK